ncbi:hypothetical protein THAOC_34104, partial [Thalassiosira oceanica]
MSSADSDGRIIMASEPAASPDDNADATASPQRPSPPNATARTAQAAQETGGGTGVGDSTAAPQYAPRDGMAVPAVSALNDGGPPVPVRQAVDHGRESDGPQLHDGPPGPPSFPLEFDDSLAKGDVVGQEEEADGPQLHHGPPGPPSFPHEFDDSLAKTVGNRLERRLPDHSRDNASAVHSTMGASVSSTAAVGPSMLGGVGEGRVSSRGTAPPMSLLRAVATAAVTRSLPSAGRSTILAEAYRVEEAEETPGRGIIYEAEPDIPPFYQRKGFLSGLIALALLAVIATGVLLLYNPDGGAAPSGEAQTSSSASDLRTHVPTINVPTSNPFKIPTMLPISDTEQQAMNSETVSQSTRIPLLLACGSDNNSGYDSGSAHVFVRSGEDWKHQAKLLGPDGAAYDYFGRSVAIHEEVIVVGARRDVDNGNYSGSAHIFVRYSIKLIDVGGGLTEGAAAAGATALQLQPFLLHAQAAHHQPKSKCCSGVCGHGRRRGGASGRTSPVTEDSPSWGRAARCRRCRRVHTSGRLRLPHPPRNADDAVPPRSSRPSLIVDLVLPPESGEGRPRPRLASGSSSAAAVLLPGGVPVNMHSSSRLPGTTTPSASSPPRRLTSWLKVDRTECHTVCPGSGDGVIVSLSGLTGPLTGASGTRALGRAYRQGASKPGRRGRRRDGYEGDGRRSEESRESRALTAPSQRHELIMASESASPDDYMDMDATGQPQPPRPNNASTQDEETIRAFTGDDDPPVPLLHVVDPEKESEGPQLHDGPPGPPRFPSEFDNSLAKRGNELKQNPPDLAGDDASTSSAFPSEFDDSLAKRAESELERNRSDHAGDNVSTTRSTMGASLASAAATAGPSMDVEEEEGAVPSEGTTPSIISHIEAAVATAPVDFNRLKKPGGGTVYEAELAEPNVVLRFYQRKGFASVMIAVSLLAVVITVVAGVLLSENLDRDTDGDPPSPEDSSADQSASKSLSYTSAPATSFDVPTPMPTKDDKTYAPTGVQRPSWTKPTTSPSLPTKQATLPPTSSPTNYPTNLPLNSSLKLLAPDGGNDFFGFSTSIYGDTIVVSDPCHYDCMADVTGYSIGSAHVFVWNGEEWSHQAKLLAPNRAEDHLFGGVLQSRDTIVVGAYGDSDNGEDSG